MGVKAGGIGTHGKYAGERMTSNWPELLGLLKTLYL